MFANSYNSIFEAIGVPLTAVDGCEPSELETAERRLSLSLPQSLRDYYLRSGREKRVNQFHNRLYHPHELSVDSRYLLFFEENQSVCFWGVRADDQATKDAPVFQGVNQGEKGIDWYPEHESCFTFLKVNAVWLAAFGGASKNTAVGYVDPDEARRNLDENWDFIGEVNEMRAYKQAGSAVCLLKWEDIMQRMRQLPPWRLFAAAASAKDLDKLKVAVPGQWEHWGE